MFGDGSRFSISISKLKKSLLSLISTAYPQVELKVIFRTTCRIADLFRYKDCIPKRLKSYVVYGVYCTDCNASYIGKTKRHLSIRYNEHTDIRKPTAVTEHLSQTNHDVTFDKVKILDRGRTDNELLIKESSIVKKLKLTNVIMSVLYNLYTSFFKIYEIVYLVIV